MNLNPKAIRPKRIRRLKVGRTRIPRRNAKGASSVEGGGMGGGHKSRSPFCLLMLIVAMIQPSVEVNEISVATAMLVVP